MTVATGSSSTATSSSSRRQGRGNRVNNHDDVAFTGMVTSSSQQDMGEAPSRAFEFPRTVAQNLRPAIGAFAPHNDSLSSAIQYITEATVEYEEFHGSPNSKGAGSSDPAGPVKKPPASKAKAIQTAYADQMAFSSDPRIHAMEDALLSIKEMQYQMEAEKLALERLSSFVAAGAELPVRGNLQDSYEHILRDEIKHIQARRKQETIATVGMNQVLQEFRAKIWEVHHSSAAIPRSAAYGRYDGDEDDDDMEIMVTGDGNSVQSLKCPLTTNFLEDPVTSAMCKHSFSSAAIRALIQARPHHSVCPVHGCNRPITLEMLQPNKALARKVARQIMIQEEMSQVTEDEYTTVE
ncbi:hypothetical protein FBU30_003162 [Linnemannia zychae]|nr:hypothetical protein FBU30_003162 [Linnemannia zychae]